MRGATLAVWSVRLGLMGGVGDGAGLRIAEGCREPGAIKRARNARSGGNLLSASP